MKVKRVLLLLVLPLFWHDIANTILANDFEAIRLFEGIESHRLQVPPSNLSVRGSLESNNRIYEHSLAIAFFGDKRRFINRVVNSGILYNGEDVLYYNGDNISFRELRSAGTPDYLFDPRLLGITGEYAKYYTIDSALSYRSADDVGIIGRESLDGHEVWRIYAEHDNGVRQDFWVDPESRFRVYRAEHWTTVYKYVTVSSYDDDVYEWLPVRVETRKYDNEELVGVRVFTISDAEADVEFSDETWSIAGLSPSIWSSVQDYRTRRALGYWDGEAIVDAIPSDSLESQDTLSESVESSYGPPIWGVIAVGLVLLAFPVFLVYFFGRRS